LLQYFANFETPCIGCFTIRQVTLSRSKALKEFLFFVHSIDTSLLILIPVKIIFHVSISPYHVSGIDQSFPTSCWTASEVHRYIGCIHFDEYYRSTGRVDDGHAGKRPKTLLGSSVSPFAGRDNNFDVILA